MSMIKEMEKQLKRIIDDNGYSEMADGFEQAMNIVKGYNLERYTLDFVSKKEIGKGKRRYNEK